MAEQTTSQFDFDDWAGLYIENPEEFEARRKAVLMIEMAKGTPEQSAQGRALLESYEKRVKGCDLQQRLQVSASMMMESVKELNTELLMLKHSIQELEERAPEDTEATISKAATEEVCGVSIAHHTEQDK